MKSPVSFLPKPNYLPSIESLNATKSPAESSEDGSELDMVPLPTVEEEAVKDGTISPEDETVLEDDEDEVLGADVDAETEIEVEMPKKSYPKESFSILNSLGPPIPADEEQEFDPELESNTLHNALMYHLSQDEVDRLDSLNESEERLLLSPTSSGILSPQMSPIPKPTSSDHTSSLSSIPLLSSSSTASSMSGTRLMKESSPEPLGKLLPHHHIKKAPTPLQTANSFNKGVSFDNLSNELDFEKLQFTLTTKHQFFKFDRTSRVFMCGYDDHECSLTALKWAIDEMLNDGDTIVCLRVLTKETVMATNSGDKLKRDGAKILESIAKLNTQDKKIKIVLEFKVGRVPEMITLAIKEFEPVVLIVGTRGEKKSGFKAMISSKSMSKYCLQYARVPVVVVNPSYQPEYHDMAWRSSSAVDENTFKGKLTNFDTTTLTSDSVDSTAAVARRPRFMRVGSSSSTKRESSSDNTLSPSRSRGFSPARALSPFRMFKKK